jgi:hypothetical protein
MISMKPHLQGIIKETTHGFIGQETTSDPQSSLGPFIAGIVLGAAGSIFAMTLAIKAKPLTQKQIQDKINRYVVPGHSPHKTVLMRVM